MTGTLSIDIWMDMRSKDFIKLCAGLMLIICEWSREWHILCKILEGRLRGKKWILKESPLKHWA